jgi:3-methyladenine DNA glycosylase AlkD
VTARRRQLESELTAAGDAVRAANVAWFFKTGKGGYGEGDRFLGIAVPVQRRIALRYRDLALSDIARLLASPIHEFRFAALEILVSQYERAAAGLNERDPEELVAFYLSHTAGVNNWDLVDTSAPYILGEHLKTRPRKILDRLAASTNLWERRIAIVSTLPLIKARELDDTFRIARKLLDDPHDLIHKAVGWALREAGRVSRPALSQFLETHHTRLPRTALRYAIEHFPLAERKQILAGIYVRDIPSFD